MTIDAIGTQTGITKTIADGGGNTLLAVKEGQGHLFDMDVAKGMKYA